MRTLYEVANELDLIKFINESLKSSWLQKLMNAAKEKKIKASIKDFIGYDQIRWDKVTDEYCKEYEAGDNAGKKVARSIVKGTLTGFVLITNNNEVIGTISDHGKVCIFKQFYDQEWYINKTYAKRQYEALEFVERYDFVIYLFESSNDPENVIINYKDSDSSSSRWNSKQGIVWQGDTTYYANLARENVKRYKDIAAKNKANSFDKLGERVKAAVDGVMDLANKMEENPEQFDSTYVVEMLLERLYSTTYFDTKHHEIKGTNGLLYLWKAYLKSKKYLNNSDSHSDMHYREAQENEKALIKSLEKIEETLKTSKS